MRGSGYLCIADGDNQRVRKVNTSGTISTVAGNRTVGYSGVRTVVVLDSSGVGVMIVGGFAERCMILRGGAAVAGMLHCAVTMGGVMVDYEVTGGGMLLRCAVATGGVIGSGLGHSGLGLVLSEVRTSDPPPCQHYAAGKRHECADKNRPALGMGSSPQPHGVTVA